MTAATIAEPVIELRDVVVRRGKCAILNASWQVNEGERWVVLGPNGAGKTTLLAVVAARLQPTSGMARILGERLGRVDVAELRPRIGLASSVLVELIPKSENALDVVLTGAYAVTGRWREVYDDDDEARARELMAEFGVAELSSRKYGTLSTGEQKRVAIARALMPDPELLLLDEPAAGLDLGAREQLVGMLARLAASPLAPVTVMVTHDVESIPAGFTHLLLMSGGAVVASGPIAETLTSANLTRAFGTPITVTTTQGRYSARGAAGS